MNQEIKQQIKALPQKIVSADAEQVLLFKCPQCGGSLLSEYTGGDKKSLSVSCEQSCFRTHIDGMKEEPEWVNILGKRIVTGPSGK